MVGSTTTTTTKGYFGNSNIFIVEPNKIHLFNGNVVELNDVNKTMLNNKQKPYTTL
jgi:hypothetical protein